MVSAVFQHNLGRCQSEVKACEFVCCNQDYASVGLFISSIFRTHCHILSWCLDKTFARVTHIILCGCVARLSHRSLAEAFDAWCVFVEERRNSLQHLQIALAHWNQATLISAWQAWQGYTLESQQRREVITRALQHFLNRTQAAAFRQWLDIVLRKKESSIKASMCLQRLLNSQLFAAFQGWREAAVEMHAKHLRMQKAAAHFLNQRVAICFLTGRAASEEALLGAAKLEHAVGHWLHGTVARVFNAWKEWAHFKAYSKPIISGEAAYCKTATGCARWLQSMLSIWVLALAVLCCI